MTTMRAAKIADYGPIDHVVVGEIPKPVPGIGEVVVRVKAAGVNPVDWKIVQGDLQAFIPTALPLVPGCEGAGIVEQLGTGVETLKVGDEVFAFSALARCGWFADYVAVDAFAVAIKPESLDFAAAAAVPVGALTAWQALFDTAELQAGETVLIHAAAGGVGSIAVQLAKWKGARVIGTASAANHDYLRSIGCDVVVDYRTQRFEDVARDVDVVLDTLGGDDTARSAGCLKRGGRLVSLGAPLGREIALHHGIVAAQIAVQPSGRMLDRIAGLIDEGKVTPRLGATFRLSQAVAALTESATGHPAGKIVLLP
jgi:NADPH:quinone reductase-like Zn-dependent oxidoreductase